jgi:putative transposase
MNSVLRRPAWFVAFNEYRAIRIYERSLPHWRQDGCTYFVTFRLADSIPVGVLRELEHEKKLWLQRHGIAYNGEVYRDGDGEARGQGRRCEDYLDQLTPRERFQFDKDFNRQVQSCLDRGSGECHLREPVCVSAVREQLVRFDGGRYHLGDFVIMPNHVHLLITPAAATAASHGEIEFESETNEDARGERNEFRSTAPTPTPKLEAILKVVKGASAVACNRIVGRTGAFWQADSYDHIVRSIEQLSAYRDYIARNPVMAGVELPPDALYRADWMDAWLRAPS